LARPNLNARSGNSATGHQVVAIAKAGYKLIGGTSTGGSLQQGVGVANHKGPSLTVGVHAEAHRC